jgi:predicted DNA-binding transcriptional regulator YafY
MTEDELSALVLMLQSVSPLGRLSNMEARTVFELMQQRGYKITKPAATND